VVAVKNVWFHVEQGECFGLLGPNGAGKTTLVNMIVGLLKPTSGDAFLSDHSITDDLSAVQRGLGLCPQFDVLYDDLSVEEHLLYYARLKGYPPRFEKIHVEQLMEEIGLHGQREQLASALSGGQKRRLSIGIALTGNPDVILLDEPTSGLDPGSKRGVWEVIRTGGRNKRSFLLTTHSMEEAEVLCTRIGIVSKGQLKCIGEQQHLKSRFGKGFKIDILTDVQHKPQVHTFIMQLIPEAKLVTSNEGYVAYQIPKNIQLSKIFLKIETHKSSYGIVNWGISQSNLEEVFLTIVRQDEQAEQDANQDQT